VSDSVARILRDRPHAASIPRTALRTTHEFPAELKEAVLDDLLHRGQVRSMPDGRILFLDRLRPLSAADQADLDKIVRAAADAGFRPLTPDEIGAATGLPATRVASLLARGLDEGRLQTVGDHVYADEVVRRALVSIRDNCLAHDDVLDIPKLRDALDTTRKFLIPLLEHVDRLGLTRLRGGERRLLRSSELFGDLGSGRAEP
jgi:selenocysteine-specific elongation factor